MEQRGEQTELAPPPNLTRLLHKPPATQARIITDVIICPQQATFRMRGKRISYRAGQTELSFSCSFKILICTDLLTNQLIDDFVSAS